METRRPHGPHRVSMCVHPSSAALQHRHYVAAMQTRQDAFSPGFATEGDCIAHACCWNPPQQAPNHAVIELPWCFVPNGDQSVHTFTPAAGRSMVDGEVHRPLGWWRNQALPLHHTGGANPINTVHKGTITLQQGTFAEAGADIPVLHFEASNWDSDILRVRITTPDADRWEVPSRLFPNNLQSPLEKAHGWLSVQVQLDVCNHRQHQPMSALPIQPTHRQHTIITAHCYKRQSL